MYANANKGYMPAALSEPEVFNAGPVDTNAGAVYWWMRLQAPKYLAGFDDPSKSVLVCPDDLEPYQPYQYPTITVLQCSYGINPLMTMAYDAPPAHFDGRCNWYGHRHPKVSGARNSSEKILVAELRWGWFPNWFEPNKWEGAQAGSEWFDWDWYRHHARSGLKVKGRSNILWLDGHVTTVMQGKDLPSYFQNDIYSAAWWAPVDAAVGKRGDRQWKPYVQ
jgi:prepilin-type processing-associated H-X9-DG protein